MIKIINDSPSAFEKDSKNSKLFLFGGGRTAKHCIDTYCEDKEVEAVIDNAVCKVDDYINHNHRRISLINVEQFVNRIKEKETNKIIILITTVFYAWEIIEQLDKIQELNGIRCYLHFLLRNYPVGEGRFLFPKGKNIIPQKIHYFWLGNNKMPSVLEKYVDTWRERCSNFEIICWNENNYDITKNRYMKEAYESKKWGFVPDYARLDIIYEYGGIYLDTDVEVLKNLEILLKTEAFFGAGSNDQINLGSGFGAIPSHPLIKQLRDYYEDKSFYDESGKINNSPCYVYQHPVLKEYGFSIKNKYQEKNGVVIYPAEVLAPTGIGGLGDFFSSKTVSIHHTELSWISEKERKALEIMKRELKKRI